MLRSRLLVATLLVTLGLSSLAWAAWPWSRKSSNGDCNCNKGGNQNPGYMVAPDGTMYLPNGSSTPVPLSGNNQSMYYQSASSYYPAQQQVSPPVYQPTPTYTTQPAPTYTTQPIQPQPVYQTPISPNTVLRVQTLPNVTEPPLVAPLPQPTAEQLIRKVLDDQVKAWNKGDLVAFMAGYWKSDKLSFFSGKDKTTGWNATLARYRKRYQADNKEMGQLAFQELQVGVLSADSAVVLGRWKLTTKTENLGGLFTLVFRKTSDGWRIVHDHTSN